MAGRLSGRGAAGALSRAQRSRAIFDGGALWDNALLDSAIFYSPIFDSPIMDRATVDSTVVDGADGSAVDGAGAAARSVVIGACRGRARG